MRPLRRSPSSTARYDIPLHTGPLQVLTGRSLLVLIDDQNLQLSARALGYKVSYRSLAALLKKTARAAALHTVFAHHVGDPRRSAYFRLAGWTPHTRTVDRVRTHRGVETRANADNLLVFLAGTLASRSTAATVLIGSGDGDLVCDLATALQALPTRRQVVTLSLAGSTSHRLDASRNPAIAANVELGLDALRPGWR
jgi:hypothetical protein